MSATADKQILTREDILNAIKKPEHWRTEDELAGRLNVILASKLAEHSKLVQADFVRKLMGDSVLLVRGHYESEGIYANGRFVVEHVIADKISIAELTAKAQPEKEQK